MPHQLDPRNEVSRRRSRGEKLWNNCSLIVFLYWTSDKIKNTVVSRFSKRKFSKLSRFSKLFQGDRFFME